MVEKFISRGFKERARETDRAVKETPGQHDRVVHGLNDIKVADGDTVAPALIPRALTAGELVFSDNATQVFEADGGTTYVENGRPTQGEWYVDDDGRFGSFWPPSYRASYDLRWIVENGVIVGLRFTELGRGSQFDGRYRD
jgi:hypothetical protein